VYYVGSFALLV